MLIGIGVVVGSVLIIDSTSWVALVVVSSVGAIGGDVAGLPAFVADDFSVAPIIIVSILVIPIPIIGIVVFKRDRIEALMLAHGVVHAVHPLVADALQPIKDWNDVAERLQGGLFLPDPIAGNLIHLLLNHPPNIAFRQIDAKIAVGYN